MRQTTYTSKPAGAPSQKLIRGGKSLNISKLHLNKFSIFVIVIVSFLCFSCEKEIPFDDDALTRAAQQNDSTARGGLGIVVTIDTVWKGETHINY